MKFTKILLLYLLVTTGFIHSQNLIENGNFETGNVYPWNGFKNHVTTDDITNSKVGNIQNGDGSLYQTFNVVSGEVYQVFFDYRWVNPGGSNMTVRIKDDAAGGAIIAEFDLQQAVDVWHNDTFSFTVPSNVNTVRIIFYKTNGNRPLRLDNVLVLEDDYNPPSFIDDDTPINSQPVGVEGDWILDFSDEFNGNTIDSNKWIISVSTQSRAPRPNLGIDDWWWVQNNAFLDGSGKLILRGEKLDYNTMYCGSVESRNLYEPTYGYMEAKIKVAETAKGNHTAFWLQGHNMGNVDNSGEDGAEIDIFESAWVTDDTKAVIHFDGYGPNKKNHTIPYDTPGIHSGFHIFGMLWEEGSIRIFYDGVEVTSTNPNKPFPFTTNPNGYPLVPEVPEWLWLSVGASFGDGDFINQPVGTLSDAEVDYVRVYKPSTTLGIESQKKPVVDVFPNPVINHLYLETSIEKYDYEIYDIKGKIVKSDENITTKFLNLSELKPGLYFFKFTDNSNRSKTHKIYKK